MDALEIERAALWGHSDGAVIALWLGLLAPSRVEAIVAEATHFLRRKPRSRPFFETMRGDPDRFGPRLVEVLERDHGPGWGRVLGLGGAAWPALADTAPSDDADLYDGRLPSLIVPTLFLHGGRDPRTEPGELEALTAAAPAGRLALISEAGHSPHTEVASADE